MKPPRCALPGRVVVFVTWLVLNGSASPGQLAFALLLALVLPALLGGLWPDELVPRRPLLALRLLLILLGDIVVANLQVAKLILGPREALKPRFVWVPLDVRRPRSISLFAGIITMTPGTVSAELSDDHRHLLVHGLRVEDPDALAAEVKSRYETPIRELFE